jgi:amino-acid N-acetyltransferase
MTISIERACPVDDESILRLVGETGLPLDGLRDHLTTAVVARDAGRIVGTAALELYADGALLRSVAVAAGERGRGLGQALTRAAIALAAARGAPAVYLLTQTAESFFPKLGFERIVRAEVPDGVQTSSEFRSVCPANAIVMRTLL